MTTRNHIDPGETGVRVTHPPEDTGKGTLHQEVTNPGRRPADGDRCQERRLPSLPYRPHVAYMPRIQSYGGTCAEGGGEKH